MGNRQLIPLKKLGQGGAGEAWLVENEEAELFTLKLLNDRQNYSWKIARAIERAYKLRGQLSENGTPQINIQNFRSNPERGNGGVLFSFHEGNNLKEYVREKDFNERAQLLAELLPKAKALCDNLGESGIAHNDIRPENIIIGSDGKVTLIDIDFLTKHEETSNLCIGPAWYVAPEVLQGKVHPHSDTFSLGVTAWTVLMGNLNTIPDPRLIAEHKRQGGDFFDTPKVAGTLNQLRGTLERANPLMCDEMCNLVATRPADRVLSKTISLAPLPSVPILAGSPSLY
ncbi:protein kinase [Candidatus Peregrinibacteria bacterium]|nr:MAG: protein kinase [Candidatus Peregrinibacteria bacterium]